MVKSNRLKNLILGEAIGFAVLVLFLWFNEVLDLPHRFFGAPASPVNRMEAYFETALVVLLAVTVLSVTLVLASRLQRANTEKNRVFGVISRDLRGPFADLISNADQLRNNFNALSEEERRSLSAGIFSSADRVQDLMENLLLWSQIQLDTSRPAVKSCDLHGLVGAGIAQVGLSATLKQIVISNAVPGGTLVDVDVSFMRSILRNLLSNAVKFSKPGGVVEVAVRGRGHKIRVQVVDRGVGMSKKELRELFQFGSRLCKEGTAGETGSGLGLLLVNELVRRSGGKLKVRSDVDKGSTFSFTLNRSRKSQPPAKPVEVNVSQQEETEA
ncbi:MAG: HAMP domain-containing sensor histidine kinase [Desulfuromonadaceae bacterium]